MADEKNDSRSEQSTTETSENEPRAQSDESGSNSDQETTANRSQGPEIPEPLKEEEPKFTLLSDLIPDRNLIKKRGFLISFEKSGDTKTLLDKEIAQTRTHYEALITAYRATQESRLKNLEEINERNIQLLKELDEKKEAYLEKLSTRNVTERTALVEEITGLNEQIFAVLADIGKLKEGVADRSLDELQAQLNKAIAINREVQDEQNNALAAEFTADQDWNTRRIAFFEKLLSTYQDHYALTAERLKLLMKDGINSQISGFLLFLGTVSSLVAGWWFSVWTGPLPQTRKEGIIVGNTDVKFFILNNLGKYLAAQTTRDIILWVTVYIIGVGAISLLCYKLLVRFGFMEGVKARDKKKADSAANDTSGEIDIDLAKEDDILNARFKGQNWWSFWLKFAPFIAATVPVLAVLSRQASPDNGFQNLFDSMINQFIGTCIAVSFSAFTILFFSRITENAYHAGQLAQKRSGFTFWFGFLIFALLIGGMFLYQTPMISDLRTVAIMGFLVSCIATGFSLGYGYLFRSLDENSEFLLARINFISSIIDHYSKPFRVNYTTNKWLRSRIYILQQKILDVIQNRQELAGAIAGGYDFEHLAKNKKAAKESSGEPAAPVVTPTRSIFTVLLDLVRFKWLRDRERAAEAAEKHKIAHSMSDVDLRYFSEKSEQINQLNERLRELKLKDEKLAAEESDYQRNQGTWRSIRDQVSNMEQKKSNSANLLAKSRQQLLVETEKLERMKNEEVTLLTEGYYTGLWFKDVDSQNDSQKLLWS